VDLSEATLLDGMISIQTGFYDRSDAHDGDRQNAELSDRPVVLGRHQCLADFDDRLPTTRVLNVPPSPSSMAAIWAKLPLKNQ
jgi:hypothetical protein